MAEVFKVSPWEKSNSRVISICRIISLELLSLNHSKTTEEFVIGVPIIEMRNLRHKLLAVQSPQSW
jgi:hypothetical protein